MRLRCGMRASLSAAVKTAARGWASLLLASRSRPPFSDHRADDGMGPAFLGHAVVRFFELSPLPGRNCRSVTDDVVTPIARETSSPVRRESESGSVASESSSLA